MAADRVRFYMVNQGLNEKMDSETIPIQDTSHAIYSKASHSSSPLPDCSSCAAESLKPSTDFYKIPEHHTSPSASPIPNSTSQAPGS